MSIGSVLKNVLGFVAGIVIPGEEDSTANIIHEIQQDIANIYGEAAKKLAEELKLDTSGMSGRDKVFHIVEALAETAVTDGFKGDIKIFKDVVLDVAQSAYRAIEPNIGAGVIALAQYLHLNPLYKEAVELVAPQIQKAADALLPDAPGN